MVIDVLLADGCYDCTNKCCRGNHFSEAEVSRGLVKNPSYAMRVLAELKLKGYNTELIEKGVLKGSDSIAVFNALEVMVNDWKMDKLVKNCLFYNSNTEECLIHPSLLGDEIRGYCGRVLCERVKFVYQIKEDGKGLTALKDGNVIGSISEESGFKTLTINSEYLKTSVPVALIRLFKKLFK